MIATDRRLSGAARVVGLVRMAGLFLILCATVISPLHAAQPIKIGVVLSLTGWGGSAGNSNSGSYAGYDGKGQPRGRGSRAADRAVRRG